MGLIAPQPVARANWGDYAFDCWKLPVTLPEFKGVYIFARVIGQATYPLYIWQAPHVGKRIIQDQQAKPILATTAHYIYCRRVEKMAERREMVIALIGRFNPPQNVKYRTRPAGKVVAEAVRDLCPATHWKNGVYVPP